MRFYTKFNRYPLFVHFRYTRNLVDEGNGKFNLIVLCWGEQQASSIHSHANSHCFMKVCSDWLLLCAKLFDWLLCSPKNFGGAYSRRLVRPSVRASVRPSVRPIRVRPITLLFEVGFRNNFTEMTTMFRRRVARNIWVPTLKVKVIVRPCSKFVSSP